MAKPQKRKRHIGKIDGRSKRKPSKRLRNMLGEMLVTKAGKLTGARS